MVQTGRRKTEKEKTLHGSREGVVQDGQGTGGEMGVPNKGWGEELRGPLWKSGPLAVSAVSQ